MKTEFKIGSKYVGEEFPTYFIADIAANHDGDLSRALNLIELAAKAGADAAKFQNFTAEKIVSDQGFKDLGSQIAHQAKWEKSVIEVYKEASIPSEWTPILKEACDTHGIDYMSAAYDLEAIDLLEDYVPAYKIGSGDITWLESIEKTAKKNKPVLLATGASNIADVDTAVDTVLRFNPNLVLMQCNTNYTGEISNLSYISLNVLKSYAALYPNVVLGLSDHTPGNTTVLGAIALGARVIEKHFTDDTGREGPDHGFSLAPEEWRRMVVSSRELEAALGQTRKVIEPNEVESAVVQRRAVRFAKVLKAGHTISRSDIIPLRPCPSNGIPASQIDSIIGKSVREDVITDQLITWDLLE